MTTGITGVTDATGHANTARIQASETEGSGFAEVLTNTGAGTTNLDAIFEEAAKKYNISEKLLKAVAKAESGFRANVTSRSGAMGIMQLMPGTAKSLGVTDAYDPYQNIMGGAKYLSQQLDRFNGDVSLALAAYNAGPGAVQKYSGVPPYTETQNYVKKVIGYMGGGEITAGMTRTMGGSQSLSSAVIVERSSEGNETTESLKQMIMMKILEMQMKSSDEKDDKIPL